jgi:NAD(P)-dependent dehydrogenase (short-subunit alcohol dehydrogenase family)
VVITNRLSGPSGPIGSVEHGATKTFPITGASSGLGQAIFEATVAGGHKAIGTVRREDDHQALEIGDPKRAADAVLALAAMDDPPMHLLLGSDALELVRSGLEDRLEKIRAMEDLTLATDFRRV